MNLKRIIYCVLLLFFGICVLGFLLCLNSADIAYNLNFHVASYPRTYFAAMTALVDFSIFELLILSSPLLLFLALFYINRASGSRDANRRFVFVLSLISVLPSSYICMIAAPSISASPMSLDLDAVVSSDIVRAATILSDGVNEFSAKEMGELSYTELSVELSDSYESIFTQYGIPSHKLYAVKPLHFSKALSYTGALALYSPPTGEINISTEIPLYMTPFTAAHEYAHYLGISGEGDANIFAFIACERSENDILRYSARLVMLEYVLSDLYLIDKEMYTNIYNSLGFKVKSDIKERIEYSKKYESSGVFRLADNLNSAHLKLWDAQGNGDYSTTGKRIACYFKNNQNPPM